MTSGGQRRCPVGLDGNQSAQNDVDADGSRVLPHRRWVRAGDDGGSETESSHSALIADDQHSPPRRHSTNTMFRVATYNILSDRTIRPGEYLYCPAHLRYMSSRHERIVAEIRHMQPHIICLQEVSYEHYTGRLRPSMKQLGYEGILLQRRDDQGLATFWHSSMFQLVAHKHATLHHLAETHLQTNELNASEREAVRKAIDSPEAVQVVHVRLRHLMRSNNNNNNNNNRTSDVAVANVHVTWSQLKYPALQALQVSLAVNELLQFARSTSPSSLSSCSSSSSSDQSSGDCAVIICGDFNSPPTTLPYQLLSRGHLDDVILDTLRRTCQSTEQVERLRAYGLFDVLPPAAFTINTRLSSAYLSVMGREPDITNSDQVGMPSPCQLCLDYIWFAPRSLDVVAALATPPSDFIAKHYALPSVDFPSDHLPLIAEFAFKQTPFSRC